MRKRILATLLTSMFIIGCNVTYPLAEQLNDCKFVIDITVNIDKLNDVFRFKHSWQLLQNAKDEEDVKVETHEDNLQPRSRGSVVDANIEIQNITPKYNPYNLLEASNITEEQAYQMLSGTALQSVSREYVYIEKTYGINAVFLMALNCLESGYGRSSLAITNNNLGGIRAGNGWRSFSDWGECIEYIGRLICSEYLNPNGVYFSGYSIWNVNTRYCTDGSNWATMINQIATELLNRLN